jgi:hypothetical protein
MRRLASFLLLGVALAAGAATEVWRWKDANGVVHYSDSPVAGAERVQLDQAPATAGAAPKTAPAARGPAPIPEPAPSPRYTRCAVTEPASDQNFRLGETVSAAVAIEPDLQPGHRIQVHLNNAPYPEWPEAGLAYQLNGLVRGTYTLSVRVLGPTERILCTGPGISFHVRQASILSPVRKPPTKK